MTAARTDIHAPGSADFDPAAYTYLGSYYTGPSIEGMREERALAARIEEIEAQGYRYGSDTVGGCGHCGANIMYVALVVREDACEWILVGETCLENRIQSVSFDMRKLRAKVAQARKEAKIVKAYRELCAAHQVVAYASYIDNIASAGIADTGGRVGMTARYDREGRPITFAVEARKDWAMDKIRQMHGSARNYGALSDKQIAFLTKLMAELDEAYIALRDAQPQTEAEPVPAIEAGRYEITGEIVYTKWQDNDYGTGSLKMLLVADNGQKFWGTVPRSLDGEVEHRRIAVTATVQPKKDDAGFAFLSRPAKARYL